MSLDSTELNRYAQQIKLDEIGVAGQEKLKNARVLCVGAGGLGSPLLLYLAAAGVGNIGIVDDDCVELSNLQRQILYQTSKVGKAKIELAQSQLAELNPQIQCQIYQQRFDVTNAAELVQQYDIIADCSDNFATHYLINDVCFAQQKPFVFAAVEKFSAQCSLFNGKNGPCYRCIFPEPGLGGNCQNAGILGVTPGLLGVIQATEILKWILQIGTPLSGKLLTINLLNWQICEFRISQDPDCACCVHKRIHLESAPSCNKIPSITAQQFKELCQTHTDFILVDVRTAPEHVTTNLGGILIPLHELEQRIHELDPQKMTVVYCHLGQRSLIATKILMEHGFKNVMSLEGGIDAISG